MVLTAGDTSRFFNTNLIIEGSPPAASYFKKTEEVFQVGTVLTLVFLGRGISISEGGNFILNLISYVFP